MSANSQEDTIYRSLAGQIQLGFYDDGERFPSAQEIARRYGVSYCPAQRALKMLERDGLVRLSRGRETAVLAKPCSDYLMSPTFRARAGALADLNKSFALLSPALCFAGARRLEATLSLGPQPDGGAGLVKCLYRQFETLTGALGSRMVLSLYYDVGSFVGSAQTDMMRALWGEAGAEAFLRRTVTDFREQCWNTRSRDAAAACRAMEEMGQTFYGALEEYLAGVPACPEEERERFTWEPHKGRTRYCDVIAIDLICKVNQGIYPVGSRLPNSAALADTYHVSNITIRRTIRLLNKLGISETSNGVGTRIIYSGDASLPYKLKDMMMGDSLRAFLEALQLLALTSGAVMGCTFPHLTGAWRDAIAQAAAVQGQKAAMVGVISAYMQAVIHCCPLAAIREIYAKLTLILLNGSVLRLEETGGEQVEGWDGYAGALLAGLGSGDGRRFGRAFGQVAAHCFFTSRQTLLEIGVDGVEEVADPKDLMGP